MIRSERQFICNQLLCMFFRVFETFLMSTLQAMDSYVAITTPVPVIVLDNKVPASHTHYIQLFIAYFFHA